jgi:hypothetical protein
VNTKFSFIFLVCLSLQSYAGPTDSLITLDDIGFRNGAEKNAFQNLNPGKTDYLEIFMSSFGNKERAATSEVLFKIDNCVKELKEHVGEKPVSKELKYIYRYIHNKFFIQYEKRNSFSDIFKNGKYNCVSSAALYAIIFQQLNIPFQIMEKPEHVFLIAYPETDKILMETTNAERGYIRFSDNYMETYVKYLYGMKIIPKEEYGTKSIASLFEKYYYSSKGISLRALAAIQYCNFGLYYMEDKNYAEAVKEIKKAYYLNNDPRNRHLLKYSLLYEISNNNYNDTQQVKNLAIICRYKNTDEKDIGNELITSEFLRLMHNQLVDKPDLEKSERSFQIIYSSVKDTSLKKELKFDYHYELARLGLMNMMQSSYVKEHLKQAYIIKPGHSELRNLIFNCVIQKVEKSTEAVKILKLLKEYSQDFPYLTGDVRFNAIKANCFLQLAYQDFLTKNLSAGENYLKEFETLFSEIKNLEPGEGFVEKAYAEAAAAYYKKGDTKRARKFLTTGLIYAPESFALRIRLSQI